MTQEIIAICYNKSLTEGLLLKLDFAKAFNMLDWHFIIEIMKPKDLLLNG